jgi:hypothetical protein
MLRFWSLGWLVLVWRPRTRVEALRALLENDK